jgi:hypothetical protein
VQQQHRRQAALAQRRPHLAQSQRDRAGLRRIDPQQLRFELVPIRRHAPFAHRIFLAARWAAAHKEISSNSDFLVYHRSN